METIRLVIIDDSATVRAMVEQVVQEDPGYHVVGVAPNVEVARALIKSLRPDLVTLDLNMPGVSGTVFLDELARRRDVPVVVLSSSTHDQSELVRELRLRGADACFDKARILIEAARFRRVLRGVAERFRRRLLLGKTLHGR